MKSLVHTLKSAGIVVLLAFGALWPVALLAIPLIR